MSYILDALRKADAQRQRDASRGIHAQAASLGPAGRDDVSATRKGRAVVAAVALLAAAVAAWLFARDEPAPAVAVVPAPPAVVQTPAAAAAISPPPPVPLARAAPAPLPAREAVSAQKATGVAPAAAASAPPPAPIAGGLPPDAPRVAISGGVYSPDPAQRMLIVNGQVFNEGSEVAPGVTVEAIQPRTAVLAFRGARYTVAY